MSIRDLKKMDRRIKIKKIKKHIKSSMEPIPRYGLGKSNRPHSSDRKLSSVNLPVRTMFGRHKR